jgi:hypothetical protein
MPNLFPSTIDETTPFIVEDGNLAPDIREMLERCTRLATADPDDRFCSASRPQGGVRSYEGMICLTARRG